MRIGINLLCIIPGLNGGMETYAVAMVKALADRDQDNEYLVFVNRQGAQLSALSAPNMKFVVCNFDGRLRELRYAWEHFLLPLQLRRFRADVMHSPGYQGPIRCHCPCIVTVPDLNFIALKSTMPRHRAAALRFFVTMSARHAAQVITISHFSKSELIRHLNIPESKIAVTPLASSPLCSTVEWELVRHDHSLEAPYAVAYAGNNSPHKNLHRLFDAWGLLNLRESTTLAIIGRLSPPLRRIAKSLRIRVQELGYVPEQHILPILSHARLCIIPSLYEGFGLPVLEAHTARVPLACSNAAALPEVAGNGARFFDPQSVPDIAAAIDHCLTDQSYCNDLVMAGSANILRFSWRNTADQTLAIYRAVAGLAA